MNYAGRAGGDNRPPKINHNSLSSYMDKFKELAPYYTPEWRFSAEEPDAGAGLAWIAGEMLEDTAKRLNEAPMNHLLAFLDLVGVKLQPPLPARATVAFELSEGAPEPVYLPAGFVLTAPNPAGGDPLHFETGKPLAATPARLMEIINTNPRRDELVTAAVQYGERLKAGEAEPVPLFDTASGANEQEHSLFVRHDELFLVDRPSRFYLDVHHGEKHYAEPELALALASEHVQWSYPAAGGWRAFDAVTAAGNSIILHKSEPGRLEPADHQGIDGRWIRCTVKQTAGAASPLLKQHLEMDKLRIRASHDAAGDPEGIRPESLYFNDTELMDDGFYPFGEQFVPYSIFYLSCEEAFSKRESKLGITFSAIARPNRLRLGPDADVKWKMVMRSSDFEEKDPPRVRIRQVMWEYWNGNGWNALPGSENYVRLFEDLPEEAEREFTLSFQCPADMTKTFVNGSLQYWIRARVLQTDPIVASVVQYMSPWLARPRLTYSQGSQTLFPPEHVYTRNNGDNRDRTLSARLGNTVFKPFEPLPSNAPTLYLSFDGPPLKGPLRLHIELQQRFAAGDEPPWLEWEALCLENGKLQWMPLRLEDGTAAFSISGGWQWSGPPSMALARLFALERYWIRAVNKDSRLANAYPRHPIAESLHLNAVEAKQQISQKREVAVSSDGVVVLSPGAYIDEEVWIDELEQLPELERLAMLEAEPERCEAQWDGDGNMLRFWVKWQPVASFSESGPNDRHYSPDHAGGLLTFGDGMRGRSPSGDGEGLARIAYKLTSGAAGRVEANQIKGMQLPIAYISSVTNPKPSIGGGHTESVGEVLLRGPQGLKHRGRAVTARDAEWIAREAYPGIAKLKCLGGRNALLERSPGSMTIVACTDGAGKASAQFPELRRAVESELLRRASSLLAIGGAIAVIEPAYLEVSVHATVAAESDYDLVPLEQACTAKLDAFLDVMTGNTDGSGWEIGEPLHVSLLHSLLHSVRKLLYIERLYVHAVKVENGVRTDLDPARMGELPHGLVVNGIHRITAVPANA